MTAHNRIYRNLPGILAALALGLVLALPAGGVLPWTFLIDHRSLVMGYMKGAADWDAPEGHA